MEEHRLVNDSNGKKLNNIKVEDQSSENKKSFLNDETLDSATNGNICTNVDTKVVVKSEENFHKKTDINYADDVVINNANNEINALSQTENSFPVQECYLSSNQIFDIQPNTVIVNDANLFCAEPLMNELYSDVLLCSEADMKEDLESGEGYLINDQLDTSQTTEMFDKNIYDLMDQSFIVEQDYGIFESHQIMDVDGTILNSGEIDNLHMPQEDTICTFSDTDKVTNLSDSNVSCTEIAEPLIHDHQYSLPQNQKSTEHNYADPISSDNGNSLVDSKDPSKCIIKTVGKTDEPIESVQNEKDTETADQESSSDSESDSDNDSSDEQNFRSYRVRKISSSSDSTSSEDIQLKPVLEHKAENVNVKKKKKDFELPLIEDLKISVKKEEIQYFGKILRTVETLVVIESERSLAPVNLDTVLFLQEGEVTLGRVWEVFGKVTEPFYCVRFNSEEDMKKKGVDIDVLVYFAPTTCHTHCVDMMKLISEPRSDASWIGDKEVPATMIDYSDDEKERESQNLPVLRRSKLKYKRHDNNWNPSSPKPYVNLCTPSPKPSFGGPPSFQSNVACSYTPTFSPALPSTPQYCTPPPTPVHYHPLSQNFSVPPPNQFMRPPPNLPPFNRPPPLNQSYMRPPPSNMFTSPPPPITGYPNMAPTYQTQYYPTANQSNINGWMAPPKGGNTYPKSW